MGLSAAPFSLTWACQHSLTALHGIISSDSQPNMDLSGVALSLTQAYEQRFST